MHPTLGILRTSQAVSYALSFFGLDGFAVPAPAQVTQTVRQVLALNLLRGFQNWLVFQFGILSLSNQGLGFQQSLGFVKISIFSGGSFPSFGFLKNWCFSFLCKFRFRLCQAFKIGVTILGKVFASKSFYRSKFAFVASIIFRQSQISKIGFKVFSRGLYKICSDFFVRFTFSGKGSGLQSHFFSKRFGKFGSGVLVLP